MNVLEKFKLNGKTALVTGGGKNFGKSVALALAEAGADVAVVSRTLSEIETTAQEIEEKGRKALPLPMDVTEYSQVEKGVSTIVSEFGKIDILVNNAAIRSTKSLLELPEAEWHSLIDTNLAGAFFCCKAAGPFMIRQGSGRVINISSRVGFQAMVNRVPYCASKGGLIQLTRALALEWAPYNILVNCIAPGLMNTVRSLSLTRDVEHKYEDIPMKRPGEMDEIAPMAVYLASEACTYMTGEVIVIDGGWAVK